MRVLDFSRILAGPYLTMLYGDLGAKVIKVERAEGDDTRRWGPPFAQGEATYFWGANRNKHSIVLDLKNHDDRALALELAETADVVVENFRPGVMDRLGLGYEDILKTNPGVVFCSISAFGDSPAAADLAGYDLLVQAVGGLMSITGTDESGPIKVGVALVDVLASLHAAVGVLAALRHRDATGEGQRVEVTLLQALLASLTNQATAYLGTGESPARIGNQHPSIAPYQTLRAADGEVALACGNDRQFQNLCRVLGLEGVGTSEEFGTNSARVVNRAALIEHIEEVTAELTASEVIDRLTGAGVPVGPVNDIAEAFATAAIYGLEPRIDITAGDRTVPQVTSPMRLSRTPVRYYLPPPRLPAAHGEEGPNA
ncbi:CaiB/BaiF CoA-transferase family protein [Pseudonocardia sp. N23]|uniref:CaiB/BaiF CoA transferase family protein n=1 Tax=Pseudonocardia sp. N23 TaxID=1987376 RepID=UPI00209C2833|nr:CoA transferase [Pseudonocardia sp. N23]